MTEMIVSPTIEDYLGIIYVLERDQEPVVGARLANLLVVSPPTVTNTLKRMIRDGLLHQDENSSVHLTPLGWEVSKSVVRKHMLSEWMLSRLLSWSKLHDEAHMLEHGISPEVATALLRELGDPELCPHGNPLPGYEEAVSKWIPLLQIKTDQSIIIRRIHELAEETPDLLGFFETHEILPGAEARLLNISELNQTVELLINKSNRVTLGFSTAKYVFVEIQE
jgi:DtxR family Mn-dependent transcriptional regulator